jgi:hypothetical protein
MSEVVNLYCVWPDNAEYSYYVFASSRNKAKALCIHHFTDSEEYIDFRTHIIAKNIGGKNNVVVDYPDGEQYERVLRYCGGYIEESERGEVDG